MTAIDWHPDSAKLRRFGWTAAVIFLLLGGAAHMGGLSSLRRASQAPNAVEIVLVAVGVGSAFLAWMFPRGNWILYIALSVAGLPVRWLVSTLVLAIAFFLIVTPMGWARRLIGGDPLTRSLDDSEHTYWLAAQPPRPDEDYFKLF